MLTQKEFTLQVQLSFYINLIDAKREQNEKTIKFLVELKQNPSYISHTQLLDLAFKDFTEYKTRLQKATEEVSRIMTEKSRTIQTNQFTHADYDVKKIQSPKLSSELFLLILDLSGQAPAATIHPSQVPPFTFPNAGIRVPPPPMGSFPPGYGASAGFRPSVRPPILSGTYTNKLLKYSLVMI